MSTGVGQRLARGIDTARRIIVKLFLFMVLGALLIMIALSSGNPLRRLPLDLGTAAYPSGTEVDPVYHEWRVRRSGFRHYRLGYRLDPSEADAIRQAFRDFAHAAGYWSRGRDDASWLPPEGCDEGLRCAYEALARRGAAAIEPVADIFRRRARALGPFSTREILETLVGFVQEIPYSFIETEPFGVLAPALVVKEKRGDCDSKALLAHMILRRLGIRSVLILSEAHRHAMLGVAIPSSGTFFNHQGTRYAFVEVTARGAPIGYVDPGMLRIMDWRVVPVEAGVSGEERS